MPNAFLGLRVGLSGLAANQVGLNVTSNNLANSGTEGYSRKQVKLQSSVDIPVAGFSSRNGLVMQGTGVEVGSIESIRDLFLNGRIRDLETEVGSNEKSQSYLEQIELLFSGEVDTGALLDDFFASLQDLANNPESVTARQVVIESAETLTEHVQSTSNNLIQIQRRANEEIADDVRQINTMSEELALLNRKIATLSASGADLGDLEDRRQVILEEMSKLINVQTVSGINSMINVIAGGQTIVGGTQSFNLVVENDASNNGFFKVLHEGGGEVAVVGGEMGGLMDIRDSVVGDILSKMDQLAVNLTERVNSAHRAGFGLDGRTGLDFFKPLVEQEEPIGIFRVEGSAVGYVSDPDLFLDGDPNTATPENFETDPVGTGSVVINGYSVEYDGSRDSLSEVVARINATVKTAHAYINENGRLVLVGNENNDFSITSIADTGRLMERMGILKQGTVFPSGSDSNGTASLAGSFDYPPKEGASRRFALTDFIAGSPESIAAAAGVDTSVPPDGIGDVSAGAGDNRNALAMADLKFSFTMSGGAATFNDFYNSIVGEVGVKSAAAKTNKETLSSLAQSLANQREEIQGVSVDEELVNMIKYQRGYQASARIISTISETLEILVNLGR